MKVYFEGSFWEHHGRGHAGKEVSVNKEFVWGDCHWRIPSMYLCGKGVVVDFCARVSAERIRNFMEKWKLLDIDYAKVDDDQRMLMDADNPMDLQFFSELEINGKIQSHSHGCSICWNPCVTDEWPQEQELQEVMEYYGLDPADGWSIHREYFRWSSGRKPDIKTIRVVLKQGMTAVPGPHFRVSAPGDCFEFVYPATGKEYTLHVQDYERQEIEKEQFEFHRHFEDQEFPRHYMVMTYSVTPEIPDGGLNIYDCENSDPPRRKAVSEAGTGKNAASVAVIGGADGPTSIFFAGKAPGKLRAAVSALHFEPVEQVEWRMVFYEKWLEDLTIRLDVT